MTDKKDEIEALLNKSESKLKTARIDFDNGQFDDSVSRSYYAVYHAISAALLSKDMAFSSHSQTIGAFNKEFIKTEIWPKEFAGIIQGLFEDRQIGDYDAIANIDEKTAKDNLNNAAKIVNKIKEFLMK
ncbi:MAG: hypothetical protein A2W19_00530 [Spirochaetes bacterium RBG_16_49_21]|nr:MAG: hypothetical protein A2W19_00530 [Spirochaetes bacterium RBG_16_49_21]